MFVFANFSRAPAIAACRSASTGIKSALFHAGRVDRLLLRCALVLSGVLALNALPASAQTPLTGITQISAGADHTCALASGRVKCWGYNFFGQLGDNSTVDKAAAVSVVGLTGGVTAISTGSYHTCALTDLGGVKCWGDNVSGQLGDKSFLSRQTPVDVIGLASGVKAISAGGSLTCALMTDGAVKCWGSIYDIFIAVPTDIIGVTSGALAVSAGGQHACAITASGGIKCWGYNGYGQLGNYIWPHGINSIDVSGLTNGVTAIDAGGLHTCALVGSGAKCWGDNKSGAVGNDVDGRYNSDPTDVIGLTSGVTAISAGGIYIEGVGHTCAQTNAGGLKCWGDNSHGQLGDNSTTTRQTPVDVVGLTNGSTMISTGAEHTCALIAGGSVKCWGNNGSGQLGDNSTTRRTSAVTAYQATPPGAPGIGFVSAGNAQATVTFSAPIYTGGAPVTGYTVDSNPPGGSDSNAGTTGLSHTITGLANGTAYTFTVTATNGAGTSVASNPSNIVTPVLPPPQCTLTASPGIISPGGFATLKATCSPAATSYAWTGADFSASTEGGAVAPSTTKTYSVTGINAAGSSYASSASVIVSTVANPFPLANGSQSYYQIDGTTRLSVFVAPAHLNGTPVYQVARSDGNILYLTNDANGYREHGMYVPNGICFANHSCYSYQAIFEPPITLLPASSAIGQTYPSSGTTSVLVDGGVGRYSLSYSASSALGPQETVVTPAGTFDAFKLSYAIKVFGTAAGQPINVVISTTDWLADGIGLVKETASGSTALLTSTNVTPPQPPYQGLWWASPAESESGWGMSITQHGSMIFAAIYTYDLMGHPVWYAMSNCPVSSKSCTGNIYQVTGGTSPTVPWNDLNKVVNRVGTGTLTFSDAMSGTFQFTLDGRSGSKAITRQIFALGTTPPKLDYSDLWWAVPAGSESGWGVALTQEFNMMFVTWYSYDANGNAIWYVASSCPISGTGCNGNLYQITGGSPLGLPWNGANKTVTPVGSVTFNFSDANNGTMHYSIDGVTGSRAITRQAF